jgi:hypothetical protein
MTFVTAVESGHISPFSFRPSADRPPVNQMGSDSTFVEQASRAYVKPRLTSQPQNPQRLTSQNYSGAPVDPPPNVGQLSTGSSSRDGRQDASLRVSHGSSPGPSAGRLSASTDSRQGNGLSGSAGGTTSGSSTSPGAVPPAYRPY